MRKQLRGRRKGKIKPIVITDRCCRTCGAGFLSEYKYKMICIKEMQHKEFTDDCCLFQVNPFIEH